ncbi:hypothetical protein [Frankia sp. Cj5]|nr:hypothetical protein [Frankia sp. Cj5]
MAFVARYNITATPFTWKYTAADLERQLARIPQADAASTSSLAKAA